MLLGMHNFIITCTGELCGLDWEARYKIIKGICHGLKYLHTGSEGLIYHMDLKPSNILLDKDMIPKIGDFGLSRLFCSSYTYVTDKCLGTP
jgi:serine/threonine protein kinase